MGFGRLRLHADVNAVLRGVFSEQDVLGKLSSPLPSSLVADVLWLS